MPARILIVEDNPANLKLMAYLLRAYGHEVVSAGDGGSALEAIRRDRPDLVVCDIQLPVLDGYGVAREAKADPALRSIPLVAVTALAMVGDRDRVLAAGFDGYIPKPIAPQTFVVQVDAFLRSDQRSVGVVPAKTTPRVPSVEPERGTILVLDNLEANLGVVRGTLEPFGYRILFAKTVSKALELARENPIDLILSDIHLPGESGFDFLRAVKADDRLRAVPFLFLTSTGSREMQWAAALAEGADGLLVRPLKAEELLAEVEKYITQRKEA